MKKWHTWMIKARCCGWCHGDSCGARHESSDRRASTQPSSLRNTNITPIYQERCCPRCIWTSGQPLRSSPGATCKRLTLFFSSAARWQSFKKLLGRCLYDLCPKDWSPVCYSWQVKSSLVRGERKCLGFKSHCAFAMVNKDSANLDQTQNCIWHF